MLFAIWGVLAVLVVAHSAYLALDRLGANDMEALYIASAVMGGVALLLLLAAIGALRGGEFGYNLSFPVLGLLLFVVAGGYFANDESSALPAVFALVVSFVFYVLIGVWVTTPSFWMSVTRLFVIANVAGFAMSVFPVLGESPLGCLLVMILHTAVVCLTIGLLTFRCRWWFHFPVGGLFGSIVYAEDKWYLEDHRPGNTK